MEYCAGGDLAKFIRRQKRIPEATARALLRQLSAGLRELWSRNLVHVSPAYPTDPLPWLHAYADYQGAGCHPLSTSEGHQACAQSWGHGRSFRSDDRQRLWG